MKYVYIYTGGAPRISSQIKLFRGDSSSKNQDIVTVHGGDALTGSLFFSLFGSKADADYMNVIQFDALVAGNHEFDAGDAGLANFSKQLDNDILSYNREFLFIYLKLQMIITCIKKKTIKICIFVKVQRN